MRNVSATTTYGDYLVSERQIESFPSLSPDPLRRTPVSGDDAAVIIAVVVNEDLIAVENRPRPANGLK